MGHRLARKPEAEGQPSTRLEPRPTFAELYESCFAFAWRMARRLGTPEASVDDVVQEIFMIAFRRQEEFEGRSSIKTWLYGIVFNVVRAHRRELGAKHPHTLWAELPADPDVIADGADGPDERAAKSQAEAHAAEEFLRAHPASPLAARVRGCIRALDVASDESMAEPASPQLPR